MGDYMRPKTAPGSEGGATLFTLRYFTQHLFNYTIVILVLNSFSLY